ncbi:hypothetical protein Ga0609869_002667 [Rhodovulum iodosum]|uniref:DUF6314 domain-containing protein n=1 Tax=Rhodovulum iodosum TaxID=68291 RepID=A0ABV3XVF8_9RHOB|nr:DUF6314 family protein [Rhodovulum robiginosum]RSK33509.1 hypothetical protein EJA01_09445 [Rhodovulum robiginosum]
MPELEAFAGAWTLDRVIEDARAGHAARLEGRAVFTPGAGGLILDETGMLSVPGQRPMPATRRYIWRQGAEGIEVFFADGRFFHAIAPGATPRARHDCPPDLYLGAYDFSAWPGWTLAWQVDGAAKSYRMKSRYRPAP